MEDKLRTALVAGVALVAASAFSGLLFVVFVMSGSGGRAPSPESPVTAAEGVARPGGPMSMRSDLERMADRSASLEEGAKELVGDNGVVCGISPDVDVGAVRLAMDGDDERVWLAIAAARRDVLLLADIPEEGRGTLFVEGYAPAGVRWFDARDGEGGCEPDPVVLMPPEAVVVGTVDGFAPHGPNVAVEVCGQPVTLDGDGGFFVAVVPEQACDVVVRRHYGVWEFRDVAAVEPTRGGEVEVLLKVPAFLAVLPLKIADGAIVAVWDDGRGAAEDLIGARVVSVDGQSAPDDVDAFHLETGGEPDSVATLEIERDGSVDRVSLARRALSFDDWVVQ